MRLWKWYHRWAIHLFWRNKRWQHQNLTYVCALKKHQQIKARSYRNQNKGVLIRSFFMKLTCCCFKLVHNTKNGEAVRSGSKVGGYVESLELFSVRTAHTLKHWPPRKHAKFQSVIKKIICIISAFDSILYLDKFRLKYLPKGTKY